MRFSIVARFLSLSSLALPSFAAPFGDSGVAALDNQLFPRAISICTCCYPASTITLYSTKLAIEKSVETVYTTSTKTQAVNVKGVTTVAPVVTGQSTTTITYTTWLSQSTEYGLDTTTTVTETATNSLPTLATVTFSPSPAVVTTYTLIGGTHFWKRDEHALVARGPVITATDCGCVNVECMTAVAVTSKVTVTTTDVATITKPAATGVIIFTTATQWKTIVGASTLTIWEVSTITSRVTVQPSVPPTTLYSTTYTTTMLETVTVGPAQPDTVTFTADVTASTYTVSYTQVAYFPSGVAAINGYGDAPATDTPENQTEEFSIARCAQWCALKPDCYDWAIRSDNGWPFGTRNPPTRYCVWYDVTNRFNENNMTAYTLSGFPWVTDTAVWKKILE
ncbi:hypothetical protein H072_6790 [Dactylellina haptotyla CBS 200.50]|uniref:Apple domain-containing protein n=1 Tax=Dactylellina haptotyla (strain CBS 200.50) TaxID=1284197 RepID=S8A9B1_DACHA|nr:hypothetical protein H072_6790 [Dactylellina haptotyla CBS 200.50]